MIIQAVVAPVQMRRYNLNYHSFFNLTIIGTGIYNQIGCNACGFRDIALQSSLICILQLNHVLLFQLWNQFIDYAFHISLINQPPWRLAEAPRGWKVVSSPPGHTKTLNWDSLPSRGLRHIKTWSEVICVSPGN
jgi:hypothetical protein